MEVTHVLIATFLATQVPPPNVSDEVTHTACIMSCLMYRCEASTKKAADDSVSKVEGQTTDTDGYTIMSQTTSYGRYL